MAGLLDFLLGQGGGGLLGMPQQQPMPQIPQSPYGTDYMNTDTGGLLGSFRGALNQMANPQGLADAYQQKENQRGGMAMLGAVPNGQQPQAAPQMPPGMSPLSNFGNAIAGIESKGQANPYAALGPRTGSGDQAYGKYQVMGANVPAWTKEFAGREMTPLQFLSDPQAQEAVFKGQFGKYLQQTGNPQDAASMWFTGQPLAQGANRADVNGMTGQRYVNQFTQNLGPQGAPQGAPVQTAQAGPPVAPQAAAGAPQAPAGQAMAGSGLTLLDSPALQGMPDTVRRAIPAMLASKQYAPQAMALMQKYINPEQWQMYRDAQGNVITRNTATGESKPLISATPDMMNAAASGMKTPLAYQAATQMSGSAAKNTELTGEQKNALASGGLTPAQYEAQQAQVKEAANKRGEAEGTAQANLANGILQGQLALKTIDQIRNHPGRNDLGSVGMTGILPGIPGTQQKGFVALVDQLKNKTFLQAYEALKGGGAITNIEGSKGESAIARLDRTQNVTDFKAALQDLEDVIKTGMKNARAKAAGISPPAPSAAATERPSGTTKSGIGWSIE
jgi:hypothetical protein